MRGSKRVVGVAAAAIVVLAGAGAALTLALGHQHATPLPPVYGFRVDRAVPDVPLLGENGMVTSLSAFRGKIVVLSPFLTLCHEVCPITTGAFIEMQRMLRSAGLTDRVAFVELTVDPWRDTPARLRAFVRLTQIQFPLLTGTPANIGRIWDFFGVGYKRVPQGPHPDTDWWTHKPETYDVVHLDGLFFIDPSGRERIFTVGMPKLHGDLGSRLRRLLSKTGLANLEHPSGAWTVAQAMVDLEHVLGYPIRPAA